MKFSIIFPLLSLFAAGPLLAAGPASQMLTEKGAVQAVQLSKNFTGKASSRPAFKQTAPATVYGAYVRFEAGARTYWHVHPMGQTLVVTEGEGLTGDETGKVLRLKKGDIVVCPPGLKHWHGASATHAMEHLAISENVPGKAVEWLQPVTEKEYRDAQTNSRR